MSDPADIDRVNTVNGLSNTDSDVRPGCSCPAHSDLAPPVEINRIDTVSTCHGMPCSGTANNPGTSSLDTIPNESWHSDIDSDFVAVETVISGCWLFSEHPSCHIMPHHDGVLIGPSRSAAV